MVCDKPEKIDFLHIDMIIKSQLKPFALIKMKHYSYVYYSVNRKYKYWKQKA